MLSALNETRMSDIAPTMLGMGEESRLRMQTIIRLRWFGVGGQLSPEQQASVLREVPEVLPAPRNAWTSSCAIASCR